MKYSIVNNQKDQNPTSHSEKWGHKRQLMVTSIGYPLAIVRYLLHQNNDLLNNRFGNKGSNKNGVKIAFNHQPSFSENLL
jgi:hypothetical protein